MVRIQDIIDNISYLRINMSRDLLQATEELGEVAKAYRNLKDNQNVEQAVAHLREEACDLMICCLSLYYGASPDSFILEEMFDTIEKKLSKWETTKRKGQP